MQIAQFANEQPDLKNAVSADNFLGAKTEKLLKGDEVPDRRQT